ncbi:unnamed protein product [Didymodactylos carnosus]|uniref:PRELI/MSF1 domain-containing protein n=1 Tax=Didymodactylos carnosus TaxID=1234261 RepID=A0A813YSV5_9BILA|nr:unnamed protein product [Didymodactylos carnosus]CAF0888306.1 unnamed protein product [Didymodactylos carnosus]CAF3632839.1 unnamed protein product [Didymodactylos carnosus]CAF3673106.1 unnamed protein product [Didymodactylos carnosus]
MGDSTLDDIRAKRMAELQKQYGGNPSGMEGTGEKNGEEQRQKQEEMRNTMLSSLLTQEARARLNTIAVAKPDKARMVEDILLQNARRGAFGGKLNFRIKSKNENLDIKPRFRVEHDWSTVVKAALQKYPNPVNPGILGCDVVDRRIENGQIISHRVLLCNWSIAPSLAKLINMDGAGYGSEHSIIDANKRLMTLRTRNLTLNRYLSIEEHLQYTPHPKDKSKTLLKQEATITVQNVPLTNYMEALIEKTINSNANKGRQAIEWVIKKMRSELPTTSLTSPEQLA